MAKAIQVFAQRTAKLTADGYPHVDNGWYDVIATMDDGSLLHAFFNGTAWSTWEDLGVPTPGQAVGYRPPAQP
jgi:hypothetical protein